MRDYAEPILKVAGLGKNGIEIVLVNDTRFNAFVAGRRIFFNTGALAIAETPGEIIGVLAHEAGHIAGGHQERLRRELDRAKTVAIVGALVGLGAGIAGATTGSRGLSQLGAGVAMGAPEIARRGILSYQRGEEAIADRLGVEYLEKTGQSARGMLRTFERFAKSASLAGIGADPYQSSHPAPRDRIANLERVRRGLYTGAYGYVTQAGGLELAMAIRSLSLRGEVGHYHTGGGIVADSDPRRELEETEWKAEQFQALASRPAERSGLSL